MNTLVEKGLGILLFLGFFVTFSFGYYASVNKGNEFNTVVSELTQMIKEDGAIKGSSVTNTVKETTYKTEYDKQKTNGRSDSEAHNLAMDKLNASLLTHENNSTSAYNFLNSTTKNSNLSLVQQGYSATVTKNSQEYLMNYDEWSKLPSGTQKTNSDINKLNLKAGDTIIVKYTFDKELVFGWKPHFEKEVRITIYKR